MGMKKALSRSRWSDSAATQGIWDQRGPVKQLQTPVCLALLNTENTPTVYVVDT